MLRRGEELWITPPRTGSRALEAALCAKGWELTSTRHSPHVSRKTSAEYEETMVTVSRAKRVYVTVRNHWTTALSWFRMVQLPFEDFDRWLEEEYLRGVAAIFPFGPLQDGTLWGPWLSYATETVRFESLLDSGVLGKDRSISVRLSSQAIQLIGEFFADEIRKLGYEAP
jgi:hypothetical protein